MRAVGRETRRLATSLVLAGALALPGAVGAAESHACRDFRMALAAERTMSNAFDAFRAKVEPPDNLTGPSEGRGWIRTRYEPRGAARRASAATTEAR